jgi:hypothetical protein
MSNKGGRGKYIIFSAEKRDGRNNIGWLLIDRWQILKCILRLCRCGLNSNGSGRTLWRILADTAMKILFEEMKEMSIS